jgi:sec-independent protein translocase protein TatA
VPNIGPAELIVIFVVALLVFGPTKLPEIGRQVGKAIREFRRVQSSLTEDFKEAFSEEPAPRPKPFGMSDTPDAVPATEPAAEEPPAAEGATPGTDPK